MNVIMMKKPFRSRRGPIIAVRLADTYFSQPSEGKLLSHWTDHWVLCYHATAQFAVLDSTCLWDQVSVYDAVAVSGA